MIRVLIDERDVAANRERGARIEYAPADINGTDGVRPFAISYEGAVLELREMNGYDDSDFYAVVWDDTADAPKDVFYASTRGWTYLNGATVDATPERVEKFRAWRERVAVERALDAAAARAVKVEIGKRVKVVRGRKVPKGTEGRVFWMGPDKFARSYSGMPGPMRTGLKLADGSVAWTAETNLEVLDPEEHFDYAGTVEAVKRNYARN